MRISDRQLLIIYILILAAILGVIGVYFEKHPQALSSQQEVGKTPKKQSEGFTTFGELEVAP